MKRQPKIEIKSNQENFKTFVFYKCKLLMIRKLMEYIFTSVDLFDGATLQNMKRGIIPALRIDIESMISCPVLDGLGHLILVANSFPR